MKPGIATRLEMRKGAWTAHEDTLLKKCIEKYGEGKWHLVPLRAGLQDEVDLILRLHKLLGNRWSLIAGRIPGRTANDVKNYGNTNIHPRSKKPKKEFSDAKPLQHITTAVIQPKTTCLLQYPKPMHG
ncbi:unnamed protein product [Lactuca virosa]|uniref:Uncharacterized protein n=1 Tax=Lactuca virosa TaxID=75947 RepID=A0AAU9LF99_9ASTR|nr:unnamed protein product [Lactuca virosa]